MGKIQVTVCEARDLHNMQHIGVPDPFVRVICGDHKYKTKVESETLNPKWDETFDFAIPDENSTQIRFEVWNKNTFDDDLMGLYTLSIGNLTRQVVKDQWYTLEESKTNAEIHIRVLALDFGAEPAPQDQWQMTSDITHDPVQRAIEDGRWRPGQQSAPTPSGPPVQQQQQQQQQVQPSGYYPAANVLPAPQASYPTSVPAVAAAVVAPVAYPPTQPPPQQQLAQSYYPYPQPQLQQQPAQPYGYYPQQAQPQPQPYPTYVAPPVPVPPPQQQYPQYSQYPQYAPQPQPQPVYGYPPTIPPSQMPPQQPPYAPQPGYRY